MEKIIKKAVLLCLAVAVSFLVLTGTAITADAYSQEMQEAAESLYQLNLFRGTGLDSNGLPIFNLDRTLTRNEAVVLLVRLLGKEEYALSRSWQTPFVDLDEWAKPYIGYAYTHNLTNGTSHNTFGGTRTVSANQFITFVLRSMGYQSGTDFAVDKAWWLSDQLGITQGEYKTSGAFTRGDMALISWNSLNAPRKSDGTTPGFEIHYIDVGQADAALITCSGHAMLVDGGNVGDSSLIYSYLKEHKVDYLDYIVCTHPHEDHVGGLAGALNYAKVGTAFCPVTYYDTEPFNSFVKYLDKQEKTITVPAAGEYFELGDATAQIVGPVNWNANVNNMSIVFRIQYGQTSFLFTGDAEREEELEIIETGYNLKSTVLKVGHHGSSSSTSYPFLYYVQPDYGVISVGGDNKYGHPTEETLSRLRDADVTVYRTDEYGTIICKSDGKTVSFTTPDLESHQSPVATLPSQTIFEGTQQVTRETSTAGTVTSQSTSDDSQISREVPTSTTYVVNINTHKFHYPDCSSVSKMSPKNKKYYTGTRDDLVSNGYSPCARCNP